MVAGATAGTILPPRPHTTSHSLKPGGNPVKTSEKTIFLFHYSKTAARKSSLIKMAKADYTMQATE